MHTDMHTHTPAHPRAEEHADTRKKHLQHVKYLSVMHAAKMLMAHATLAPGK